jgi:hypothetical protein
MGLELDGRRALLTSASGGIGGASDTRPVVACEHCRGDLHPREVTPRPGPGASADAVHG